MPSSLPAPGGISRRPAVSGNGSPPVTSVQWAQFARLAHDSVRARARSNKALSDRGVLRATRHGAVACEALTVLTELSKLIFSQVSAPAPRCLWCPADA